MPVELHQVGHDVGAADVVELLWALLDHDNRFAAPGDATLADCDVQAEDLKWLWGAVCEEFSEHPLAPELSPGALDLSMTLEQAASVMALALSRVPPPSDVGKRARDP
ncbi:MAG: hypothetical protein ACRDZX_15000 [Acidimicrobiales bacterium]